MELILLSLIFAFTLGFTAHRAGVCSVAAVGEVITSGSGRMFLSFLKVVLWVVLINGVVLIVSPQQIQPYASPDLSMAAIAGGFVFGIGAAVNGGCSFSTISRIAQGDLHVALTLPAFITGAIIYTYLPFNTPTTLVHSRPTEYNVAFKILLVVLSFWAIYELGRILKSVLNSGNYLSAINAKRYRLSTAAALIGICSAFLYLAHGRWAYSSRLLDHLSASSSTASMQGNDAIYLISALLAGAVVSALFSGQFKVSFARDKWHRNLGGGLLMGFGAIMVPGGNAKLLLHDIPNLAIYAIAAYLAMVAGIALALGIQKSIYGKIETVCCAGDECQIIKD